MTKFSTCSSLVLLLLISFAARGETKDTCHALALSGGANRGSYEAGVIYGMSHILKSSDLSYDVVTGVSAGALNAGAISLFPIGQEKEMSEWLVNLWQHLTTD